MRDNPEFTEGLAHLRRCLNLLDNEASELVAKMRREKTNVEIWEQVNALHLAVKDAVITVAIACDDSEGEG